MAERNPDAAIRVLNAIRATFEELLRFPGLGRVRDYRSPKLKGMRMRPTLRYNTYLVFYLPTDDGIASRILFKNGGGNLTLFAFDAGQGLTEHTSPFEAFVIVLDGAMALTVGGRNVTAAPGTIVRLPGNVPHALEATAKTVMLLVMLREPASV